MTHSTEPVLDAPAIQAISLAIAHVRGQRIILDADLAALYGVETKRLNEQVKRNGARFPADFMFQLSMDEFNSLRSQIATLKTGRGQHRKYLPYAFTEHGAIMAAMVLGSPRAVEVSVYVIRAFVRLREAALLHKDLAERLASLEEKTEALAMSHDAFSRNARNQLRQVFEALRELTQPPEPPNAPLALYTPKTSPSRTRQCARRRWAEHSCGPVPKRTVPTRIISLYHLIEPIGSPLT